MDLFQSKGWYCRGFVLGVSVLRYHLDSHPISVGLFSILLCPLVTLVAVEDVLDCEGPQHNRPLTHIGENDHWQKVPPHDQLFPRLNYHALRFWHIRQATHHVADRDWAQEVAEAHPFYYPFLAFHDRLSLVHIAALFRLRISQDIHPCGHIAVESIESLL